MGWDYTTPIGGEFFFLPFQHSQLLTKMASRVLIGFLNITGSHMLKHDVCSLTCLAACTPFLSSTRMQLLLEAVVRVGFLIFSFHISSTRMQLLCLLKINASVFVKLFISYFFCAGVVQLGLVQMGVDHFRELKKWSSSPWLHKIVRQFTIWSSIIFCV